MGGRGISDGKVITGQMPRTAAGRHDGRLLRPAAAMPRPRQLLALTSMHAIAATGDGAQHRLEVHRILPPCQVTGRRQSLSVLEGQGTPRANCMLPAAA